MTVPDATPSSQRRVLLVEDEALVSMLIEDMLSELGCEVIQVAGRVDEALLAVAAGCFELAILDLNLAGQRTYPVADELTARRIPYAFVTAYGRQGLEPAYAAHHVLPKPFRFADLARIIDELLPAH